MYSISKQDLFDYGVELLKDFCQLNNLILPPIKFTDHKYFGYYKNGEIFINLKKARTPGKSKWSYSFPGNTADITPIGILTHEFGHYIDYNYLSGVDHLNWDKLVIQFKKEKVTSYEPNNAEKFAESFKLYITNPMFLKMICPNRFNFINTRFTPLHEKNPLDVLNERNGYNHIIESATKKLTLIKTI